MPIPRIRDQSTIVTPSLFQGTKPKVRPRPENRLLRLIENIEAPFLSGPAGVKRELQRREAGKRPVSILEAYKKGFQERITYADLTDNTLSGLVQNIAFDPLTAAGFLIPGAAVAKAFTPVRRGLKAVSTAAEVAPGVRRAKLALGGAFVRGFRERKIFGKAFGDKLMNINEQRLRDIHRARVVAEEEVEKILKKHVPRKEERAVISDLIERKPPEPDKIVPADVMRDYLSLSDEGKMGYQRAAKFRMEFEADKLAKGLVTEETINNFAKKFGISYVAHRNATKDDVLRWIDDTRNKWKAGDADARAVGSLENIDEFDKAMRAMPESPPILTKERLAEIVGEVPFQQRRAVAGTIQEIKRADEVFTRIEDDIAVLLGVEKAEIGRAVANKDWVERMARFLESSRLSMPARFRDNPALAFEYYRNIIGAKSAKDIVRKGFMAIDHPLFEDVVVPKLIGSDLAKILTKFDSPTALKGFFNTYRQIQNVWKAWTLSVFPAYHARNLISNLWLNFLAGMDVVTDPKIIQDYMMSGRLLWKKLRGVKLESEEAKLMTKLRSDRVLEAGFISGEAGEAMRLSLKQRNLIQKMVLPDSNFATKFGFATGQYLESWTRLAHYFWRIRKGDVHEAAVKSVHKWQYDWLYGLTNFEQKAFRDFIFPFYGWFRFNVPLQIEALITRPGRSLLLPKTTRAIEDEWGGPPLNEMILADWMKKSLMVRARYNKKTGNYEMFGLNNWIPFADLTLIMGRKESADAFSNLLSPFIKVPIEIWFNYDLFRKRKVVEFPGQRRRFLGGSLPARAQHLARSIRLLNEVDRLFFDPDAGLTPATRILRAFSLRTYPVNAEKQRRWWDFELRRRIGALRRAKRVEERRAQPNERQLERLDKLLEEADYLKTVNE